MLSPTLTKFLNQLTAILRELETVQHHKRVALARLDLEELERHTVEEGRTADRLAALARLYHDAVLNVRSQGQTPPSFKQLIASLPDHERAPLTERLNTVRQEARSIQRQAAANWLTTFRLSAHVHELLEVMGQTNPTSRATHVGGLVFNQHA